MIYLRFSVLLISFFLFHQSILAQGYIPPQRGDRGYTPPPIERPANSYEAKKDVPTIVEEQMPTYTESLNLDAFEQEIIKNLLIDYYTKRENIRTDFSLKYGDKQDTFIALETDLHEQMSSILAPEELEQFKKIQFLDDGELRNKKRKKKKGKKNKKDKKEKGTL